MKTKVICLILGFLLVTLASPRSLWGQPFCSYIVEATGGEDPGEDIPPGPGSSPVTYWVTNSADGARLHVRVIHPQDWDGETLPTLVLVPGGAGSSSGFLSPIPKAQIMADAGLNIVIFDPDGRGRSEGVEDHNGYIHQDGLAAVIEFAATLPEVDRERIGLVSYSYGVTMASGALARHPELPVAFFVDWEGPANRNDTGGCDEAKLGHLQQYDCNDEDFWREREASTFALQISVPYQRLQSAQDHVQPDVDHALLMVANATDEEHGGHGIAPWTRLNDLEPNTVYAADSLPSLPPKDFKKTDQSVLQAALELFGLPPAQPSQFEPPPQPTGQSPIQGGSEKRCGDGVCDGPENPQNCSTDCAM